MVTHFLNILFLQALQDVSDEDDPELEYECKKELNTMIEAHDKFLEQRGPISDTHRTFLLPFNATLRKKKKYKKEKLKKQVAIKQHEKTVPLYEFHGDKEGKVMVKHYKGNFHSMCKGNSFDSQIIDYSLRCRFQHHKNPYLILGPFKLEELNQNPFIVTFKNILYFQSTSPSVN